MEEAHGELTSHATRPCPMSTSGFQGLPSSIAASTRTCAGMQTPACTHVYLLHGLGFHFTQGCRFIAFNKNLNNDTQVHTDMPHSTIASTRTHRDT